MAFDQSNPLSNLSITDERYSNQQLSQESRAMDLFPVKGSDALPDNWSYDSALDLFSLTPADMDPVAFDFTDGFTNSDTKDLFLDPVAASTAISGFTMPTEDTVSLSSDIDSDDQSWRSLRQSIDLTPTTSTSKSSRPTRNPESSRPSRKWSSSPEIKPQQYPSQTQKTNTRKTRSFSQDNDCPTPRDPHMRNAAKRAAHNIIEKRYRTNMNAKFLALEKAISPAGVHKQTPRTGTGSLKKSEILTNALAYIEDIQQDNHVLRKELAMLRQNLLPDGMWRASKHPRV